MFSRNKRFQVNGREKRFLSNIDSAQKLLPCDLIRYLDYIKPSVYLGENQQPARKLEIEYMIPLVDGYDLEYVFNDGNCTSHGFGCEEFNLANRSY